MKEHEEKKKEGCTGGIIIMHRYIPKSRWEFYYFDELRSGHCWLVRRQAMLSLPAHSLQPLRWTWSRLMLGSRISSPWTLPSFCQNLVKKKKTETDQEKDSVILPLEVDSSTTTHFTLNSGSAVLRRTGSNCDGHRISISCCIRFRKCTVLYKSVAITELTCDRS